MGLSWGFAYFFSKSYLEKSRIELENFNSLFIGIFISAWIGAKLFFLWFSSGPKIYQYLYANYFWLGGGFVFYGGLLFGLSFYLIWSVLLKKFEPSKGHYLLPGLIFGHAIGRVGCFLTGCCYGSVTNGFLGIKILNENRYPVQLFEAIFLIGVGFLILKKIKSNRSSFEIITFYLFSYSLGRFLLEFLRGDQVRGILFASLSSSQWISIVIICSIVLIKIKKLSFKFF